MASPEKKMPVAFPHKPIEPGEWPALLGYNKVIGKSDADGLVRVGGDPLIVHDNRLRYPAFEVFRDVDAFDAGELRSAAGISLMWRAPVGPISISYAFPLRKEDNDEIERLQFTFGGAF